MSMIRQIFVLMLLVSALGITGARAQDRAVTIKIGKGHLVQLAQPANDVVIADPAVADVKVLTPKLVWVFGKAVGETVLSAIPAGGKSPASITLMVVRNSAPAQLAARQADALTKRHTLQLAFAGNRLVIAGPFRSLGQAVAVSRTATSMAPKGSVPVNLGTLPGSQQITLSVRIAEVSNTALNQLGINWNVLAHPGHFTVSLLTGTFLGNVLNSSSFGATSVGYQDSNVSVNTLVNALQQQGVLRMLAEPNLTTISGETANFLAGGEIPIPVPQSFGVTTIVYKDYGVSLSFTPTLLPGGRIALHVMPEVSEIASANGVSVSGFTVPAFTTERVDTNVEMASGQTIVIGGLFQKSQQSAINQLPVLGSLPVLGPLFKSTQFQNNKTELVVLITPYITQPIHNPRAVVQPTETLAALRHALQGTTPVVPADTVAGFAVN